MATEVGYVAMPLELPSDDGEDDPAPPPKRPPDAALEGTFCTVSNAVDEKCRIALVKK